jgi:hypothetical protein
MASSDILTPNNAKSNNVREVAENMCVPRRLNWTTGQYPHEIMKKIVDAA